jgi:hypothetical protein
MRDEEVIEKPLRKERWVYILIFQKMSAFSARILLLSSYVTIYTQLSPSAAHAQRPSGE